MTTFVLEMRSTQNWEDCRYRTYTTSPRKAEAFKAVPKIAFTDSGHGIIAHVSEHSGKRLPRIATLADHVNSAMGVHRPSDSPQTHKEWAEHYRLRADELAAALLPFAKLGSIILAEAPAEAKTIVLFTSTSGEKFSLQLDYFRKAAAALATPDVQIKEA